MNFAAMMANVVTTTAPYVVLLVSFIEDNLITITPGLSDVHILKICLNDPPEKHNGHKSLLSLTCWMK